MMPLIAAAMASKGGGQTQGGDGMSTSIKYLLVAIAIAIVAFFGWRAYKNYQEKKKATENNNLDTGGVTAQMVYNHLVNKKGARKLTASELDRFYKAYSRMYAAQLRAAFNPSGYGWMISMDTTNTKEVLKTADNIRLLKVPFASIAAAYFAAYADDLNLRLQKELNTPELRSFYQKAGLQGITRN